MTAEQDGQVVYLLDDEVGDEGTGETEAEVELGLVGFDELSGEV